MPAKGRRAPPNARATRKAARQPSESSSSSHGSSSLSPVKSTRSMDVDEEDEEGLTGDNVATHDVDMEGEGEDDAGDDLGAEEEDGEDGGDGEEEDDEEGQEGEGDNEEEDNEEEDGEDDEDEEGDDDEDEEEEDEDEDEDDEEDEEEDGDEEDGDEEQGPTFRYPASVPDWSALPEREKKFKVARFMRCTTGNCDCTGLQPPAGANVELTSREEMDENGDEGEEHEEESKTAEGWWSKCGQCGHGWDGEGHCFPRGLDSGERLRRGRVVGRIEELLQDEDLLTTFPTPHPELIASLLRQLNAFQRPTGGKKPVAPLPPPTDLTGEDGSPFTPRDGTPAADSDDEPPRKRSKKSPKDDGEDNEDEGEGEGGVNGNDEPKTPPKQHGKKPGGKTAGKGTKPRTVVRGSRGLIPMETDAEGNQHVAGRLPDSTQDGEEEEEEDDVPLAQRPQLDEGERRRREVIKEKEREKEDEVMRRLTKGANVEDGAEGHGRVEPGVEVEVWEGVELLKLPPRPAMVEQQRNEIMLPVVASRNPTPVSTILLIGLKNLFQRQLPKMPREYITRLVLDKNHISMAIVKRGWKVVGGICYRPFESRGFAEIVFCAVDSSEQIKGYGSHLMNSLKDHVRKAHPTINHFLTYADNYAVGYFKKQGFTKEITLDRERWVGYIKDYEGGTIMQCTMLPKVKYLDVHQMLADQKAAVLAKIRTISRSHIIHSGLTVFKDRKPGQEITLSKEQVPGLVESGWNPDLDEIIRQPKRNPDHVLLQLVLNDMQNDPSAWPFTKPVDKNVVVDYYDVITEPMDLSTMEYKLENNHYEGIDDFLQDARLMFNNCRQYNGERSTYTLQANRLEKSLEKIVKNRRTAV